MILRRLQNSMVLLAMLGCSATSNAAAVGFTVTLPLEGYFRPGRYMPVHLKAEMPGDPADELRVLADQSVWAFVASEGSRIDAVVPLMPISAQVEQVSVNWTYHPGTEVDLPLHPLGENQRLVGFAGGGIGASDALKIARQLDAQSQWLAEPLDSWQPVAGIAECWETVDLMIFDAPTFGRIEGSKVAALVGGGVTLLVQSPRPPDAVWPWKAAMAGWWMLRYVPAGPQSATYNPQAYAAVSYFPGGLASSDRWRLVIYGVGIEAGMLLLVLIGRRRLGIFWAVALGGGFMGTTVYLGSWQRPSRMVQGSIEVVGPDITQNDAWAFETSPNEGYSRLRWIDGLHLVLSAPDQWAGIGARLVCFANGKPDVLFFNLMPNHKVAVYARRCGPHGPAAMPAGDGNSPMHILAKDLYLKKGDRILGQVSTTPLVGEGYLQSKLWPTVVIGRGEGHQD
jgi:hypothetical protein